MPSFLGHPRATTILVPAPVYATWSPAGTNPNITLSNGNLTAEVTGPSASTAYGASATAGDNFDAGKRYVEISVGSISGSAAGMAVGFTDTDQIVDGELGDMDFAYALRLDGFAENAGNSTFLGNPAVPGDILALAIHAYIEENSAKAKIWFGVNGIWLAAGNPATGANPVFDGVIAPIATDWAIRATMKETGDRLVANFGSGTFIHVVPAGFGAGWGNNIS